ncbi:MAG TPA: Lrp/AsnC family transcriptional regulator [Candidatus Kapabacteria bacterium]|nr:Lrp/AsnC family transcriptional regulator [Candidatus Kapabacteria bacterium]
MERITNSNSKKRTPIPAIETLGLDRTDLALLKSLQRQGRTKRNELAEEVGLSLPAVSERMRKLEERGILEGVYAKLDPKLIGLDVAVFITVTVESSSKYPEFLHAAKLHPEVLEIHAITGDGSHLVKARTWNTSTLERLLSQIQQFPGVKQTRTNVVLSTYKETMALPIEELTE